MIQYLCCPEGLQSRQKPLLSGFITIKKMENTEKVLLFLLKGNGCAFFVWKGHKMKKRNDIRKLTLAAMFLALAFVLPFLTGQIPQIGSMLCPMHIPVLLCGFFCGAPWGLAVGLLAPVIRSFALGMPPMFPTAFCMAFELAAYGFVAGWLYNKLPKRKVYVYVSLLCAMVLGRIVWGVVMFACMGLDASKFGLTAFVAGAFTNAIPGIVLQIILIPVLVILLDKNGDK